MRFLLACLLAALLVFLWGFVSWTLLPWHNAQFREFSEEGPVTTAVRLSAGKGSGVYMIPSMESAARQSRAREGQGRPDQVWQAAFDQGPLVLALVRPGPSTRTMAGRLVGSFLIQFAGTLLLGWILLHCPKQTYGGRVAVCAAAGAFAGVVGWLPAWNWFDYPLGYCLVSAADLLIGGLLAGLVLAKMLRPHVHPHHQF